MSTPPTRRILTIPLEVITPHLKPTGGFNGEPATTRLSGEIDLGGGRSAYIQFIEVFPENQRDDGEMDAVNDDLATDLDCIARLSGCLRHELQTVLIDGKEYVFSLTPDYTDHSSPP